MTDDAARLDAARRTLDGLRATYRATAARTVALFGSLAAQLTTAPDDADAVATLVRELHRLRGTAGSFGFTDASRLAEDLEQRAKRWAADPQCERDERADAVHAFAVGLRAALA